MNFRQIPPPFHSAGRHFVNFQQVFVQLGNHPSTSINSSCGWETYHQLPSTFCAARRPSVYFHPLSMRPGDLLSTSGKIPYVRLNFRQLPSYFERMGDTSTSMNVPCSGEAFRQISAPPREHPYTYTAGRQKTFHQLSMWLGEIPSDSVIFPCDRKSFQQLPAILSVPKRLSVNFNQLSVRPGELLSTFHATWRPSVNFPCGRETFRQLLSTFRAARQLSVNLRRLFMRL